jgi:hypothetical protein
MAIGTPSCSPIAMGYVPVSLQTSFDLNTGRLHVRRSKGGEMAIHPIGGKEIRALRRLQRENTRPSPYVFISERGAPLSIPDISAWWQGLA